MAIKEVAPAATGGGNGNPGSPWTIRQAGQNQQPGDIIEYLGGTYPNTAAQCLDTDFTPVNSGTQAQPIIHRLKAGQAAARLSRRWIIDGVHDLRIENIDRRSDANSSAWYVSNAGCQRIYFLGGDWTNPFQAGGAAVLMRNSTDITFDGQIVRDWFTGDMMSFFFCEKMKFVNMDASQVRARHSIISLENCQRWVARNNYYRNNLARAMLCLWANGGPTQKGLVDHCAFIDCDWNNTDPNPTGDNGDGHDIRFSLERAILRDSLFVGHNKATGSENEGSNASVHFNLFNVALRARNNRYYNLTVFNSRRSGIAGTRNVNSVGWDATQNRYYNCVVKGWGPGGTDFGFRVVNPDLVDWRTWKIENMMIWKAGTPVGIDLRTEAGTPFRVDQIDGLFPTQWKNTLASQPIFVNESFWVDDDGVPHAYTIADLEAFFTAYRLSPSSPGYSDGRHLARTTQGTAGTTITVDDALPFYDGWGIQGEVGDEILVGSQEAVVVSVVDDTHLLLDRSLNVIGGTNVYLKRMGNQPARGIIVPKVTGGNGGTPVPGGTKSKRRFYFIPSSQRI